MKVATSEIFERGDTFNKFQGRPFLAAFKRKGGILANSTESLLTVLSLFSIFIIAAQNRLIFYHRKFKSINEPKLVGYTSFPSSLPLPPPLPRLLYGFVTALNI